MEDSRPLARRVALRVDAPPQLTPDAARVLLSLLRSAEQTRVLETDNARAVAS
jgi:hypothetical protein